MKRYGNLFDTLVSFEHLMESAHRAARGKRHRPDVYRYLLRLERNVLTLQSRLLANTWRPSGYRTFLIREPKVRLISAAPFADRVVHHALVGVLEPIYERIFVHDSYACRQGKGTHKAVARYQEWARQSRYFLKMDVRKFFPSIDHEILLQTLARKIKDRRVLELASQIVDGSNPQEPVLHFFPGDDPMAARERRHGLPIGNQTSQFFSNVYLNPLDHFVLERLGARRYLRYMDDFVVLGESSQELWEIFHRIESFLAGYRLMLNPQKCFVSPVSEGLRLLGYRVFPGQVRLPGDNVVRARRRFQRLQLGLATGRMSFDTVTASVRSWLGHASHADTGDVCDRLLAGLIFKLPAPARAGGVERG